MASKVNTQKLREEVEAILEEGLQDVVEGATEDIRRYAQTISQDLTRAGMIPDPKTRNAVVNELLAQSRLLAEMNRLRAVNEAWDSVDRIVATAVKVGVSALVSVA